MSSTFAFHPTVNEVIPFSAEYSFPNQATRQSKRTVKLTPKNNAQQYQSGTTMRFEFPASGYLNPNTTYLSFNCRLNITTGSFTAGTTSAGGFEFQNNIQSLFRRVRVLYGSLVLEDIQDYNLIQRMFTEVLTPSGSFLSATTMGQGIGPTKRQLNRNIGASPANNIPQPWDYRHDRQNYHATGLEYTPGNVGTTVRRYAVPINTGLFQQRNLIPLKYMASQLQVEIEIADAVDCGIWVLGTGGSPSVPSACVVSVGLPEVVAELLEFDSEFDAAIYDLLTNGLPISFQSYHTTTQTIGNNLFSQINVQESSRSVRWAAAVILDDNSRTLRRDYHHFITSLNSSQPDATTQTETTSDCVNGSAIESYQWRLGGTYYPSQPVPCYGGTIPLLSSVDGNYCDPCVEAVAEVMKTFGNLFGDDGTYLGDLQGNRFLSTRRGTNDTDTYPQNCFIICGNFMSDRGDIISGINAEEQNDMQLLLKFVGTSGGSAKTVKIVVCYDNLMILGEANNMVLVN